MTACLGSLFSNFPMLGSTEGELAMKLKEPFADLRMAFVLHFLTDLLPFVSACQKLGLAPKNATFFYKKKYPYPHQEAIQKWLEKSDFKARPLDEKDAYLKELAEEARAGISFEFMIVEDGGYMTPELHKNPELQPLLERTIGTVEQTTKGIRKIEEIKVLEIPVLSHSSLQIEIGIRTSFLSRRRRLLA